MKHLAPIDLDITPLGFDPDTHPIIATHFGWRRLGDVVEENLRDLRPRMNHTERGTAK